MDNKRRLPTDRLIFSLEKNHIPAIWWQNYQYNPTLSTPTLEYPSTGMLAKWLINKCLKSWILCPYTEHAYLFTTCIAQCGKARFLQKLYW